MATLNPGVPIRIVNGSSLRIYTGATTYDTLAYFEAGTFQYNVPGRAFLNVMDNSELGHRIKGDVRPVTGSLSCIVTAGSLAQASVNVLAAIANAYDADGDVTDKKVELRILDTIGAATGTSIAFNKFALPNGYSFRGQPQAPARLEFQFESFEEAPTITDF